MSNFQSFAPGEHVDVEASVAAFKANMLAALEAGRNVAGADKELMRAHDILLPASVEAYRAFVTCIRDGISPMYYMSAAVAAVSNGMQINRMNAPAFVSALARLIDQENAPSDAFVHHKNDDLITTPGGRA